MYKTIYNTTDKGNSQRFADAYSVTAKCCDGEWMIWTGKRWELDDTKSHVQELAMTVSVMIQQEIDDLELTVGKFMTEVFSQFPEDPAAYTDDQKAAVQENTAIGQRIEALTKWKKRSEMKPQISAIISLAASHPSIKVDRKIFDSHNNLLNCNNGVVDLYTGALQNHSKELYLSQLCEYDYDPCADSKEWNDVIKTITTNHPDLPPFLQTFFGYVAQGYKGEELIVMIYGEAATGKSTFLSLIGRVLGNDYTKHVASSSLLKQDRGAGSASGDIARLSTARFVLASEFERGTKMNESFMKMLSGNDMVVARQLYGREKEFWPHFQICFQSNYRPEINTADKGIIRRYREIPFDYRIPNPDPDIKNRLMGSNDVMKAILNWIVQGCVEWHKTGKLITPQCVTESTQNMLEENDALSEFIADSLIFDPQEYILVKTMRTVYQVWCDKNQIDKKAMKDQSEFNVLLKDHGLKYGNKKLHGKAVKVWFGCKLTPSAIINTGEASQFSKESA